MPRCPVGSMLTLGHFFTHMRVAMCMDMSVTDASCDLDRRACDSSRSLGQGPAGQQAAPSSGSSGMTMIGSAAADTSTSRSMPPTLRDPLIVHANVRLCVRANAPAPFTPSRRVLVWLQEVRIGLDEVGIRGALRVPHDLALALSARWHYGALPLGQRGAGGGGSACLHVCRHGCMLCLFLVRGSDAAI